MVNYPKRSQFFAHKTFRLMHKTSLAAEIGRDAFCIIAVVLHTEDAARYRGPVKFYNSQLQETLGFAKWDSFNRARQKAIDSGWLQYEANGNRGAGLYFITIPDGYDAIDDSPIEPMSTPEDGYNAGYNAGYKAGIIEGIKRVQCGVQLGDNEGELYNPSPKPIPNPKPENKPVSAKRNISGYSEDFEKFWDAYPRGRKTQKKKAFNSFQKALKAVSAEEIIKAAARYASSDVGQSQFVVGPAVFLNNHMWEDDPEAWSRGKEGPLQKPPTPPKPLSDPDVCFMDVVYTKAARSGWDSAVASMLEFAKDPKEVGQRIARCKRIIDTLDEGTRIRLIPSYEKFAKSEKVA